MAKALKKKVAQTKQTMNDNPAVPSASTLSPQTATAAWMKFDHLATKAVNANESTSLAALIAYIAYASGKSAFSIERAFADRFCIPNMRCLPSALFDEAIRYLVALAPAAA